MGMGDCTSFDAMKIRNKVRQSVRDCITHIEAKHAYDVPSFFRGIHVYSALEVLRIKEANMKRGVTLSAEKYCPATITFGRAWANNANEYEITISEYG